jgi:DNA repair exonuclease SbcCD ATPase subunit
MKFVTFQRLKIKNFLSIGDDEVVIDFKKGVHIITGINRDKQDRRNGVGKSTIADALYFAVFGNTVREIKKEYIANNLTNEMCRVELSFNVNSPRGNDEYVIVRTLNPSKLNVFKNGVDKTRDSIINTTEYINLVLSSSPEIFQNCVVMTANNTSPFMAKGKVEKRKFIEQVFNLQIFSQMLSNLREDINNVTKSFDIEKTKHDEIVKSIEAYENQKLTRIKERQDKINLINKKISNNDTEIQNIQTEISNCVDIDLSIKQKEIFNFNKAYDNIDDKIKQLIAQIASYNSEIKTKTEQHSRAGTNKEICPTCLRPIDLHDREHIEHEKAKLKDSIDVTSTAVVSLSSETSSLKDKSTKIKKHLIKINDELNDLKVKLQNKNMLSKRLVELNDLNKQLQDNINDINENADSFNDIIEKAKERLTSAKTELDNLKKIINLLDAVKFVVSEEGVKSYIVKKILQNFNSKLTHYLKKLDSNSICIFNEYFEEEILNEKGKICAYNNFSGAERKAIDLACLFSFIDMRKSQGNVHYNVSIYDELFDSSLDEKGVDIVLEILKERSEKYNECIFIISHRKESIKSATGDVVFLEKHNGITRRVNFVD